MWLVSLYRKKSDTSVRDGRGWWWTLVTVTHQTTERKESPCHTATPMSCPHYSQEKTASCYSQRQKGKVLPESWRCLLNFQPKQELHVQLFYIPAQSGTGRGGSVLDVFWMIWGLKEAHICSGLETIINWGHFWNWALQYFFNSRVAGKGARAKSDWQRSNRYPS